MKERMVVDTVLNGIDINMRPDIFSEKNAILFKIIPKAAIIDCVEKAFEKLMNTNFGDLSMRLVSFPSQIFCTIFHELIVHEISNLEGWKSGKQNREPDLTHESGVCLQVKTNSAPDIIAGNRHSAKNKYSDPSEYYLCVNFIPNDCICKIRVGWVDSLWWKPQKGNGNAATLSKEKMKFLEILYGDFVRDINLISVDGVGEKSLLKLHEVGIFTVKDLLLVKKYINAKKILRGCSFDTIDEMLLHIS